MKLADVRVIFEEKREYQKDDCLRPECKEKGPSTLQACWGTSQIRCHETIEDMAHAAKLAILCNVELRSGG